MDGKKKFTVGCTYIVRPSMDGIETPIIQRIQPATCVDRKEGPRQTRVCFALSDGRKVWAIANTNRGHRAESAIVEGLSAIFSQTDFDK